MFPQFCVRNAACSAHAVFTININCVAYVSILVHIVIVSCSPSATEGFKARAGAAGDLGHRLPDMLHHRISGKRVVTDKGVGAEELSGTLELWFRQRGSRDMVGLLEERPSIMH